MQIKNFKNLIIVFLYKIIKKYTIIIIYYISIIYITVDA